MRADECVWLDGKTAISLRLPIVAGSLPYSMAIYIYYNFRICLPSNTSRACKFEKPS